MNATAGRRSLSIRSMFLIIFIASIIITVGSTGILVFFNWSKSVDQTTAKFADDMNRDIYAKIEAFMYNPEHINNINHKVIENDILDMTNAEKRDQFFVGILKSYNNDIYSFSYGSVEGEYYGARRNENGVVEIMHNDASTGWNSLYYSVRDDMTAGVLVKNAGQFDPRTRLWYIAAATAKEPVFSPIYKHFVINDITISASWPIFGDDGELRGVLGTHILLNNIGTYFTEIVADKNGYAFIIEKSSGLLIANSIGANNFTISDDSTLKRFTLLDIDQSSFQDAYEKYLSDHVSGFTHKYEDNKLYVNVREFSKNGLDWMIISAVPESLLSAEISRNLEISVMLAIIAVMMSIFAFYLFTRKTLKPMNRLLEVAQKISDGDLSQRVDNVENNEVGIISKAFNDVADKMQYLISNLEITVAKRTEELYRINELSENNKNQLRLILDSTAEAIYGIDTNGNCTFCNESCLRMLGYSNQIELLGKNMHWQIHHSYRNGERFPAEKCSIYIAINHGRGTHITEEVFWRADGTSMDVEYHSYPQFKDGKLIGAVITFMDITERRKDEAKITYLSNHDELTGLINRRCFESTLRSMNDSSHLPLTIIFADINGLKMTNDIFGHSTGDDLIKKSAEILKENTREGDIVARVGGDEFIMLLPDTSADDGQKIIESVRKGFSNATIEAIRCSISLGADTMTDHDQKVEEVITNAENEMYKEKTLHRSGVNSDMLKNIIDSLHNKNPREKQHSEDVSKLSLCIGKALKLSETELRKLNQAAYLHDIGKIVASESILTKDVLNEEESEIIRQHSIVGYRILNLFDDTLDLADGVYSHHEKWDGTGYPKGLKGKEIPLMARIISVAEIYNSLTNTLRKNRVDKDTTIREILSRSGKDFDPKITKVFLEVINNEPNLYLQSDGLEPE